MPEAKMTMPSGVERIQRPEPLTLRGSTLFEGDSLTVLRRLPFGSVRCAVTSPPHWGLRDYGIKEQIGLEGRRALSLTAIPAAPALPCPALPCPALPLDLFKPQASGFLCLS